MVSVDVKYHVYFTNINNFKHKLKQSPGEIKRREVREVNIIASICTTRALSRLTAADDEEFIIQLFFRPRSVLVNNNNNNNNKGDYYV